MCHNRALLGSGDGQLRSSALLALTKLMVVDPAFCEANLQLLFTLLQSRCAGAPLRAGDLAAAQPRSLSRVPLRGQRRRAPWRLGEASS